VRTNFQDSTLNLLEKPPPDAGTHRDHASARSRGPMKDPALAGRKVLDRIVETNLTPI
jgi:hypothetical protein